jgi:hypothetical protein
VEGKPVQVAVMRMSTLLLVVLLAMAAVAWLADQLPDESGLWPSEPEANAEADRIEAQVQAMRRAAEQAGQTHPKEP